MAAVNDVKLLQSFADYKSVRYKCYFPILRQTRFRETSSCHVIILLVLLHRSTYVNNSPFHRPSGTGTTIPRDKLLLAQKFEFGCCVAERSEENSENARAKKEKCERGFQG